VEYPEERDAKIDVLRLVAGNGYVPPDYRVVYEGRGTVVVEIVGEHDLASRDTIRDLLVKLVEANSLLVVDLSEATFIDSSFLGVLLIANSHAENVGSRVRLQLGSEQTVQKVLEISGLTKYMDCVHDRDEAVR